MPATSAGCSAPTATPLTPNWRHLPIGYHGRAGTVVVTGTDIVRPQRPAQGPRPSRSRRFGPSRKLDIEAELGWVVGVGSTRGVPVPRGGLRRARVRGRHPERLVGPRPAGVGVRAPRPVPRQELRHVDLGLGAATGGSGRRPGRPLPEQDPELLPYLRATAPATPSTSRSAQRPAGQHLPVRGDVLLPRPDAGPHDGQRGKSADRRPVRVGHHLRARAPTSAAACWSSAGTAASLSSWATARPGPSSRTATR